MKKPPFDDALELTVVGTRRRLADPALQWFRRLLRQEAADVYGDPSPPADAGPGWP